MLKLVLKLCTSLGTGLECYICDLTQLSSDKCVSIKQNCTTGTECGTFTSNFNGVQSPDFHFCSFPSLCGRKLNETVFGIKIDGEISCCNNTLCNKGTPGNATTPGGGLKCYSCDETQLLSSGKCVLKNKTCPAGVQCGTFTGEIYGLSVKDLKYCMAENACNKTQNQESSAIKYKGETKCCNTDYCNRDITVNLMTTVNTMTTATGNTANTGGLPTVAFLLPLFLIVGRLL
ncbi:uncharacterized protein LOC102352472 isoform X2 [Latimeria chalumnae]|uniref:uncharacterized protein LOC102352472 isoform X2 n=1 Tax=Latimeria chalumnae TaxID=7897 RepID=UPI00313D0EC3